HLRLLLARRHAREPPRSAVPRGSLGHSGCFALLPRRDPPRDLADHERDRAVHRRQVLRETVGVMEPDGTISLEARGRVRRRKSVNRLMEALAAVAALGAVAILGIVVFNVLQRGLPAINLDL